MKAGNISQTVWKRSVRKQLKHVREEVLFPPSMEEACSAIRVPEGQVAVYAGAQSFGNVEEAGIYAAARALNEVASWGADPVGLSVQAVLPLSATEAQVKAMTGCMESVCSEAGVQLTCLKVESNPAVNQAFFTAEAVGSAKEENLTRAADAAPGEDIILCGYIGLEGMLRILAEREEELGQRFVPAFIRQMKGLRHQLLGIPAIRAAKCAGASAVHQIGSGGILAALWELAEASGIGLEVALSRMSIRQETVEVCEYYHLNPYQMTSTGSFLMTAADGDALVKELEGVGARAVKLGVATDGKARVITSGEEQRYLDRPAPDELMLWWERALKSETAAP
ncbi:hydrogenase expression/formation protein HypE [Faecalicatena sp. AGMB00832]|uniref:Hydrogenase expression/formation protein HypE n=1 Tax=Faecalicatena faecalis TaxID=2726362 RepID=A0ABS6D2U9_9FIRM|nr:MULTISPECIES: AIR synthase-related protein [Faecalicatena]MBU3875917.1 hydrogenase expression/formation protein HypE [Faecalicatena faecalis]MCI6467613.1 AIR synthase-related protein [Faecalicatena sp.]MDY5619789.1 AIR synthase-related protein [Lachnospiraceae bacterium]